MDTIDLLQRLALSLSVGLLIGIERGWQDRQGKDGSRAAGVRTYALIGLLGGLCAAMQDPAGSAFLVAAFLAFAASLAIFEWREAEMDGSASATGMIAGLVTFTLGAYAVLGSMAVAGAAAIATTIVLAERQALHAFVARLSWRELRAALLLLAMTFVLLPLLPDRAVDPWQALNPRQLWLMMVIIAAVSYVGYIGVRLAGERVGLIFAAAAGGFVSSTAVTLAYARLSRLHPQSSTPLAAGVLASWAISLLRMSGIAIAVAPALLWPLGRTLAPAVLILAGLAAFHYRQAARASEKSPLALNDPFELGEVAKFGLLLAAVTLASKLSNTSDLQFGLLPLAAVSGLVDVDPITLSSARMAGNGISAPYAAAVITVAAGANLFCKCLVAAVVGSRSLAVNLAIGGMLAGASVAAKMANAAMTMPR